MKSLIIAMISGISYELTLQAKRTFSILTLALTTILANAQSNSLSIKPDSLSMSEKTHELQEVVVKASKVIRKADMDVYYPSKSAVEHSKNGVQTLQNLMIPALTVNEPLGSITSAGETVQVRINGRVATVEQVKQLLPETIKRIEWIDNPGLRYGGTHAVLNFIVFNPLTGGSMMFYAMPALNTAWGQTFSSLKLNHGRSQWSASADFKLSNHIGIHRDYNETFTKPDGSQIVRTETPQDGYISDTCGGLQLDYSYTRPDTTMLWIAFHGNKQWPHKKLYNGLMSQSGATDYLLRDFSEYYGFTPTLSAYLEQHFAHRQVLAVELMAQVYNGKTVREYTEEDAQTQNILTDVHTAIKDRNQAYGLSADYIKKWEKSRLTLGFTYNANRNRSTYESLGGNIFHQRQDKTYFYGEYFQRIDKVMLTGGLGLQYTDFKFRESSQGSSSWNLRPRFSATYRPTQVSQFALNFTSWNSAPSLSETTVAEQQIDGFQWSIGNPNLKTSSSYRLTLRYNYTLPQMNGSVGLNLFSSPDAIAPFIQWQGDRLVTSYENSDGFKQLILYVSPNIEIIPKLLTVSGNLQYLAERMEGCGYKQTNHNWSGEATAQLQHWGFTLTVQYRKARHGLWGEKITWGETISLIQLAYDWKQLQLGVGALCPFTKYDQGSKSLNQFNWNESHMRLDLAPMFNVTLSYNLQWGRQKQSVNRFVSADAEVQQSKAAGR